MTLLVLLLAATLHTQAFNLNWQDTSDNETGFIVEQRKGDGSYLEIGRVDANVTSFRAPAVTGALQSRWCYAVKAVNEIGESGRAEGCGEITGSVPEAPINLLVQP